MGRVVHDAWGDPVLRLRRVGERAQDPLRHRSPLACHPRAQQQGRDADPPLRPSIRRRSIRSSTTGLPTRRPGPTRGRCGARAVGDPRDEKAGRSRAARCPCRSTRPTLATSRRSSATDRCRARAKKITKRYDCAIGAPRSVDRGIKQIVRALKQVGELGNTVLVFTSDNGFYFGEHRIARDKTHPYEEGRVPLMIRIPVPLPAGCRSFPRFTSRWRTSTWRPRSSISPARTRARPTARTTGPRRTAG